MSPEGTRYIEGNESAPFSWMSFCLKNSTPGYPVWKKCKAGCISVKKVSLDTG